MLKRVAELAREWASPVFVGQLDLRQAFDKIKHSAVIEALLEKQVPLQLIAVLVAWWSQSEVSVRLQSVSSHRKIRVQRGVPQGAPDSPLVFVMTTDWHWEVCNHVGPSQMQVGPLTRLLVGCGCLVWLVPTIIWSLQGLNWPSPKCSANAALSIGKIGLEVALDKKTFWSSSVDCTGRSLVVNWVSLPWSPSLEVRWKCL